MFRPLKTLVILACLMSGVTGHAEILNTPRTGNISEKSISIPVKGMTMQQVEAQFGHPDQKLPAVGDPPIIRWIYDRYTIYFERQYVIHTVIHD